MTSNTSFWHTLPKPIIGLAPMDGVTDAAFRFIADTYGKPDILMTEFTNAEGICAGAEKLLYPLVSHHTHIPTIAQLFGADPEAFYKATFVVLALGFDGIDINMGCPDKNVARHGGGAALIRTPKKVQEIIKKTQQAVHEWAEGKKIEKVGLKQNIINWVKKYTSLQNNNYCSLHLQKPISIKTRIGYDTIITKDWISTLLETEPAAITIHGRTLTQKYSGHANWEEIAKAAELIKKTQTICIGNGDITSYHQAQEYAKKYGTDGVLIGRAAFGNPWIFQNKNTQPTIQQRFQVMIEHCEAFDRLTPQLNFLSLRKHLGWYCKGFPHASKLRTELMKTSNTEEVRRIISIHHPHRI